MLIAGVDEAGRGALAGPVVAASVIFRPGQDKSIYTDSKKLSPKRREELLTIILRDSLSVGIGIVHHDGIDRMNILHATFAAMTKAIARMNDAPDMVLVDGIFAVPSIPFRQKAVVKGDLRVPVIGAASIVAKVTRDRIMRGYHHVFPEYLFFDHKGYGTEKHYAMLVLHGPCRIHRKTFTLTP
jgi:ribonuclease HII